jgi:hypothetical protein
MTGHDKHDNPLGRPSARPSNVNPRTDGGPRPSNLSEKDREADPDRKADRRDPGSTSVAGPHAQPSLTNDEATPGAGTLPDAGQERRKEDIDVDAATG